MYVFIIVYFINIIVLYSHVKIDHIIMLPLESNTPIPQYKVYFVYLLMFDLMSCIIFKHFPFLMIQRFQQVSHKEVQSCPKIELQSSSQQYYQLLQLHKYNIKKCNAYFFSSQSNHGIIYKDDIYIYLQSYQHHHFIE